MADLGEIIRALYGSWRFARRDPGALSFFDTSVAGAWRSFTAAALFAPFNFLFVGLVMGRLATPVDPTRYWTVEVIAYAISWVAFPVAAAIVLDQLDRRDRFPAFLCVYNWATLTLNMVFVILNLLIVVGWMPTDIGSFVWLFAYLAALYYLWFVTRVAADVPGLAAAGMVALDQALNYTLLILSQRMY